MIRLTKLNGATIVVNAELIETVESTPDTVITFTTGKKIMVSDSVEDVMQKTVEYKRKIVFIANI